MTFRVWSIGIAFTVFCKSSGKWWTLLTSLELEQQIRSSAIECPVSTRFRGLETKLN